MDLSQQARACEVCGVPSSLSCAKCSSSYYCSRDHQVQAWKAHKNRCFPVKSDVSAIVGRHLIATRDVQVGELLLRDRPLVIGPQQVSQPLCLGCHSRTCQLQPCKNCGWPVCCGNCEKSPNHQPECVLSRKYRTTRLSTENFSTRSYMFGSIMVLRALHLQESDPAKFDELMKLQSHLEERRGTEKYELDEINVVGFIRNFLKIPDFTDELIQTIIGIIDTNSFLVPDLDICALFPFASLAEHNCVYNAVRSFDSSMNVVFKSVRPIAKGEAVSICYTDPLWGTQNRRFHLAETKYFLCKCERCCDPRELGTNLSTLICEDCPSGAVMLVDPLNPSSDWKCSSCGKISSFEEIESVLMALGQELSTLKDSSIEASEQFLREKSCVLHPNHYYMIDVARAVLRAYDAAPELLNVKRRKILKGSLKARVDAVTRLLMPS